MGVRFQTAPDRPTNDVIIHIRTHDPDISLQQESVGILGVNLIHACFFHHDDPQELMTALYDNVSRHVVEIDMIQMNGPDFSQVDNRLLSLQPVSYTHLRAHETVLDLVCRLLLEKKTNPIYNNTHHRVT